MKIMFKIGIILSLFMFLQACHSISTHGKFITDHKDAWFDGFAPGGKPAYPAIDREEEADKGLVYCRANVKEDGSASPVCFKPKFVNYKR